MKTELRVYATLDSLKDDFRKTVENIKKLNWEAKIIPNREIIIKGAIKITFLIPNDHNYRGLQPDSVIIDEMLPPKVKDYIRMSKKRAEL